MFHTILNFFRRKTAAQLVENFTKDFQYIVAYQSGVNDRAYKKVVKLQEKREAATAEILAAKKVIDKFQKLLD
jgi:hypothetical protein